jgi:hypothetical protein
MGRVKGAKDLKPRKNARDPNAPRRRRAPSVPKASPAQQRAQAQAATHGTNGINGDAATKLLKALIASHEERLSIMGAAMNECRVTHEADKELLTKAKAEGMPVRAVKAEVKRILLERKVAAVRDDLEPDDQVLLDMVRAATPDVVRAALGTYADLPLGQAAVDDAERRARAIGSLAGGPGAPSVEDHVKRNVDTLEAGIKTLN